jgi:putative photosynthetic complex assembly protein
MSHPQPDNILPRKALIAVAALIGFTLVLVTAARITGYNPKQAPDSPAVITRDLRFADGPEGVLWVLDVQSGAKLAVLPAGNAGFVRGVLRALMRDRHSRNIDTGTPLRLARLADGRLTLRDLGSERVIELNSFGPSNVGAFAAFLEARPGNPDPPGVQDAQPAPAGRTDKTL